MQAQPPRGAQFISKPGMAGGRYQVVRQTPASKAISNKILGAQTACKEGLKALHGEMREGNERVDPSHQLMDSTSCPQLWYGKCTTCAKESLSRVQHILRYHHRRMPPGTPPAGIFSDVHVWSSWICIQLWSADTQSADTQCADDQHTTDAGNECQHDFDGVNGKYSNSSMLLPRLQGMSNAAATYGAFGG